MISALKKYVPGILFSALIVSGNAQAVRLSEPVRQLPVLQVRIVLSPAASKTLIQGHESITAFASWYGWPVPQRQASADEVGQINLGHAEITLPAKGGIARFTPKMMKTKRLDWIKDDVYVNVNVSSARRHWPDNILSCDFIDGVLADVGRNPVTLRCSLIKEQVPNRAVEH